MFAILKQSKYHNSIYIYRTCTGLKNIFCSPRTHSLIQQLLTSLLKMSNLWRPRDTVEEEVRPTIHDTGKKKNRSGLQIFQITYNQRFSECYICRGESVKFFIFFRLHCIQVLKGNTLPLENMKNDSL